jgi:hypothetical protein
MKVSFELGRVRKKTREGRGWDYGVSVLFEEVFGGEMGSLKDIGW